MVTTANIRVYSTCFFEGCNRWAYRKARGVGMGWNRKNMVPKECTKSFEWLKRIWTIWNIKMVLNLKGIYSENFSCRKDLIFLMQTLKKVYGYLFEAWKNTVTPNNECGNWIYIIFLMLCSSRSYYYVPTYIYITI